VTDRLLSSVPSSSDSSSFFFRQQRIHIAEEYQQTPSLFATCLTPHPVNPLVGLTGSRSAGFSLQIHSLILFLILSLDSLAGFYC